MKHIDTRKLPLRISYALLAIGIMLISVEFVSMFISPFFNSDRFVMGLMLILGGGLFLKKLKRRPSEIAPTIEKKYFTEVPQKVGNIEQSSEECPSLPDFEERKEVRGMMQCWVCRRTEKELKYATKERWHESSLATEISPEILEKQTKIYICDICHSILEEFIIEYLIKQGDELFEPSEDSAIVRGILDLISARLKPKEAKE